MLIQFLDTFIAGLLLGGLYALISMGLSLQYGVARVLNISQGEFMMIAAMLTWWLYSAFGMNPLLCLVIVGPLTFIIGYILHHTIFHRLRHISPTAGAFESTSMLTSFGILFIIQNVALIIWGSSIRSYSYLATPVNLAGALFGANRLITLGFAIAIGIIFYLFLIHTRTGKAIRAAAQDAVVAGMMGVNVNRVLTLCFGLGAGLAGIAGLLISMCYPVHASMGLEYTIIAIIVVVLGGLGSIPGSFLGGFILGIIGSVVMEFQPGLTLASYYVIFIILLLVRPTGILGK